MIAQDGVVEAVGRAHVAHRHGPRVEADPHPHLHAHPNTHLDAGRSPADREARRSQLDQMRRSIEAKVAAGALILAGDLNAESGEGPMQALLKHFEEGESAADSVNAGGDTAVSGER